MRCIRINKRKMRVKNEQQYIQNYPAVFFVFKIIPAHHINDRLTHIKYELNCNLLIFAKSKPQQ